MPLEAGLPVSFRLALVAKLADQAPAACGQKSPTASAFALPNSREPDVRLILRPRACRSYSRLAWTTWHVADAILPPEASISPKSPELGGKCESWRPGMLI